MSKCQTEQMIETIDRRLKHCSRRRSKKGVAG
jgi:hypothetical protein